MQCEVTNHALESYELISWKMQTCLIIFWKNHQFQNILYSDGEQMVGGKLHASLVNKHFCFKLWSVWVNWNQQEFLGTFSLLHHAAQTIMGEAALSAFMQSL